MYSQGENFYFTINDKEYELIVLANFVFEEKEYIISETFNKKIFIFLYDDIDDEILLLEDEDEAKAIVEYWKEDSLEDFSDLEEDIDYLDNIEEIEDIDKVILPDINFDDEDL